MISLTFCVGGPVGGGAGGAGGVAMVVRVQEIMGERKACL